MCPSPSLTSIHVFQEIEPCFHCSLPEGFNSDTFFGSVSGCNVVTFFGSVSVVTESFGLVSGRKKREPFSSTISFDGDNTATRAEAGR